MKIAHLCLSCFYIDGYSYQENELVAQHVAEGHDVVVIASTETYGPDRRLTYVKPGEYLGSDGARVIRLGYRKGLPHVVARKIRAHPGLYKLLQKEAPDIILFHGLCGWELKTVARYKRAYPGTSLFVDSHEDANNSARTAISKYFLHMSIYRPIILRALKSVEKVLCVSMDTIEFVKKFYGVPEHLVEFYPLGGKIFSDEEYAVRRAAARYTYDLADSNVLFVQSGKIDASKKLLESLAAFSRTEGRQYRFLIAGHISDSIREQVSAFLRKDARIKYVGWKSPEELRDLLCAADVYVQPGTQSATMQMSLCCRCVVILDDVRSHKPFVDGNGWLVGGGLSLEQAFTAVSENVGDLREMSARSGEIASRLLDYRVLAARLFIKN